MPYAASYIFYASPKLAEGEQNSIAISNETAVNTIKGTKTTIKSVKALGKAKIKITWGKNALADGYQIAYRKKGGSYQYVTVNGKKVVSKVLTNLKKGKTYQIKVRAFQKENGKMVYGSFSKVRTVKCK
ncbi:Fibronectin type III domain-containing protein [Lachnospiraceae bacterium XBB1006]|nr:Fibronectin type III domain-containing protein [Lachnospiraceae bacterium XBB1006]